MRFPALVESFRARLLLLLALMLGLTLGIQYYFNLRSVKNNARMIIEQEQAIMTGIGLGLNSLQSKQYLDQIVGNLKDPLLNNKNARVQNILVVDDDGNVLDSLQKEYVPQQRDDNTTAYFQFERLHLPPLRSAVQYSSGTSSLFALTSAPAGSFTSTPEMPGNRTSSARMQ